MKIEEIINKYYKCEKISDEELKWAFDQICITLDTLTAISAGNAATSYVRTYFLDFRRMLGNRE